MVKAHLLTSLMVIGTLESGLDKLFTLFPLSLAAFQAAMDFSIVFPAFPHPGLMQYSVEWPIFLHMGLLQIGAFDGFIDLTQEVRAIDDQVSV